VDASQECELGKTKPKQSIERGWLAEMFFSPPSTKDWVVLTCNAFISHPPLQRRCGKLGNQLSGRFKDVSFLLLPAAMAMEQSGQ
jgi:hypothetical protein